MQNSSRSSLFYENRQCINCIISSLISNGIIIFQIFTVKRVARFLSWFICWHYYSLCVYKSAGNNNNSNFSMINKSTTISEAQIQSHNFLSSRLMYAKIMIFKFPLFYHWASSEFLNITMYCVILSSLLIVRHNIFDRSIRFTHPLAVLSIYRSFSSFVCVGIRIVYLIYIAYWKSEHLC